MKNLKIMSWNFQSKKQILTLRGVYFTKIFNFFPKFSIFFQNFQFFFQNFQFFSKVPNKICNRIFLKWGGGSKAVWIFFQKFILFGSAILASVSEWVTEKGCQWSDFCPIKIARLDEGGKKEIRWGKRYQSYQKSELSEPKIPNRRISWWGVYVER